MIEVRTLRASDRHAWERLFQGYNTFYGRDLTSDQADRTWKEIRNDDRIHALGARLDDHLVGIAHFLVHASTTSPDVCYLQDLFTDPGARGRGVARALIAATEKWAREHGCSRLYWHTHESNRTARRLYDRVAENRGFIQYVVQF
ncbi:GNAT family N-acetyltransferase [Nocardia sp. CDC159]|uniref:GNAT family N-acetyltransferase n=1 Tax=Nocardia pulmonis TaxID=2951408 RepID=A0A9X2E930_9NOCA|nr:MULTISPECIES: GNAT family N-acetyltransferase [Nocardia]MCM6773758.1 GNAT family N-acetyltransferase [Nocardia pulmonis]MCM6786645.1 GNAT family N-acetyltransferase [Nocardia sp. CDC159]